MYEPPTTLYAARLVMAVVTAAAVVVVVARRENPQLGLRRICLFWGTRKAIIPSTIPRRGRLRRKYQQQRWPGRPPEDDLTPVFWTEIKLYSGRGYDIIRVICGLGEGGFYASLH